VIEREITGRLTKLFRQYPFVVVTGPRQAGKTTLCRAAFSDLAYRSLYALDVRAYAESDPRGFNGAVDGSLEIQETPLARKPERYDSPLALAWPMSSY